MDDSSQKPSAIAEVREAVRKEAVGYVAKAVVATAVGTIGIVGLGLWFYVKTILPDVVGGVPRGAVLAFDRDDLDEKKCPLGWRPFLETRARAIVGAGRIDDAPGKMAYDQNGEKLAGYVFRQHGGEQKHIISINEMPNHQHQTQLAVRNSQSMFGEANPAGIKIVGAGGDGGQTPTASTSLVGGNGPINILSPYVALWMCKKD